MNILELNINQISNLILEKSKHQRSIIIVDRTADLIFINSLLNRIKKMVLIEVINLSDVLETDIQLCDYKCVVFMCSAYYVFKLNSKLSDSIRIITFCKSALFFALHQYRDAYLVLDNYKINDCDILIYYNLITEKKWNDLLNYQNYKNYEPDLKNVSLKKLIDDKELIEYRKTINLLHLIEYFDEDEINIVLYIRLLAIKYMCMSFAYKQIKIVDVYKEICLDNINSAYNIINNENILYALSNCGEILYKSINELLNKINIKINQNKLKLIINTLKILINKENTCDLLKCSYLFGIFDSV